jgi:hypothetical protein
MNVFARALPLLLFVALGCGGSAPPPAEPSKKEHVEHEEHHQALAPALHDFHEVLAPVWHLPAGAERVTRTCAQASALRDRATATSDGELIATVAALSAACGTEGRADVEARLGAVHERFHALAEH